MREHAAFLRAMNLGRHRRVSNEQLREAFAGMGFADVATFRASGNVAFSAPAIADEQLEAMIERGLEAAFGYEVPTFVRSAPELAAIAAARPFDESQLAASTGRLQVALLAQEPTAAARDEVLGLAAGADLLAFSGRELYWLPHGGLLESPLDMKALASLLGAMTVRTKGTVEQLAAKHFACPD